MAVFLLDIVWHCDETTITLAQGHRSSGRAEGEKNLLAKLENTQKRLANYICFACGNRAVSAALYTPKCGAHAVTGGPKFSPVTT